MTDYYKFWERTPEGKRLGSLLDSFEEPVRNALGDFLANHSDEPSVASVRSALRDLRKGLKLLMMATIEEEDLGCGGPEVE